MNQNSKLRIEPPDLTEFYENWYKFPLEEQAKYAGQHVAYSLDGKRIVASGNSREELDRRLEELGIQYCQVVHGYVDDL